MLNQQNSFDFKFWKNSLLVRFIYANFIVFVGMQIILLVFWLFQMGSSEEWISDWLAVPASLKTLIIRPWTLFSYMFLHIDLGHVFFNMLFLFLLGRFFVEFFGERKLWSMYIAGGIAGALLFILFFNVFPVFTAIKSQSVALGASASVMAIIIAAASYAPNHEVRLFFLGSIKLKYFAIFFVVLDLISISKSNAGGHIAHLGGAAMGYFFAQKWRQGKDISRWVDTVTAFIKAIFAPSKRSKMKVEYKRTDTKYDYNGRKKEEQKTVDEILDKISRSGYDSLTKKEKDFLFRASNKGNSK